MYNKIKILAVDDEDFNLDIINSYLIEDGYDVISAENGEIALQKLEEHPDVSVIVLDRMMPKLNGMEVIKKLKSDERFKDIPIVMQTAAASTEQIVEGIQAGVYYYLTKPYDDSMLLNIVKAAIRDASEIFNLRNNVRKNKSMLGLMDQSRFKFRTLDEARNLAQFISNCFPDPDMVIYGLNELVINAVEHGNLGITYSEKSELVMGGAWLDEVERRLSLPENQKKYAYLNYESSEGKIKLTIKDQGKGFDWEKYLEISPERATDLHGRGIATSRMISFSDVQYIGNGNEVVCTVNLN